MERHFDNMETLVSKSHLQICHKDGAVTFSLIDMGHEVKTYHYLYDKLLNISQSY